MADHAAATAVPAVTTINPLDRHHLLLRRLHSLSGIIPVGLFVCVHLFTNFQLLRSGAEFQHEVDFIHSMPALLFVEIGLWSAIGFHAALGLVYTFGGKPNVRAYPWLDNWRYLLQRVTGIIALLFIFLHIATLRWGWNVFGWFTPFYHRHPVTGDPLTAATTAAALQASWLVVVFYLVGALSVVYHWANGLWTAAITWGLTLSVGAQKRWGWVCLAMGLALSVFTVGAVAGALKYDISAHERALIQSAIDGSSPPAAPEGVPALHGGHAPGH